MGTPTVYFDVQLPIFTLDHIFGHMCVLLPLISHTTGLISLISLCIFMLSLKKKTNKQKKLFYTTIDADWLLTPLNWRQPQVINNCFSLKSSFTLLYSAAYCLSFSPPVCIHALVIWSHLYLQATWIIHGTGSLGHKNEHSDGWKVIEKRDGVHIYTWSTEA